MEKERIFDFCQENLKDSISKIDEPMCKHTSFKIGGNADVFVIVNILDDLKKILEFSKKYKINLFFIGNGSNILVKDNGIRGIVVKLNFKNIDIKKDKDNVIATVGAGVQLGFLAQKLLNESITGFEFASGIPGTIGGAIRMNAGAFGGEFKDIVSESKCMDYDGNIFLLKNSEHKFSYRHSIFMEKKWIVIETKLILKFEQNQNIIKQKMDENLLKRKSNQPIKFPSAGSTFKRGDDYITAKLIDECGLKGYKIGDAMVSDIHAGFVVNTGNATAKDVLDLIEYIKNKVFEKFNKKINLEIEVVGE